MKNAARCLSDIRAMTRETTKRLITILLLPGDLEGKTVSLSVVSLKKISGFFVNKIPVSCSMYDVTVTHARTIRKAIGGWGDLDYILLRKFRPFG